MATAAQLAKKAASLLREEAVIITGAEIDSSGVMQRVQLYFESGGEAVMDIVNKDDLVQNWPETGVYSLISGAQTSEDCFRRVRMFEGAEDMYFRIDELDEEKDDFGALPTVLFMETVEEISRLKIRNGGGK